MCTPTTLTLLLSAEGDAIEIQEPSQAEVIAAPFPIQVEATACRTQEQVLALLEKIKHSEVRNTFRFHHSNNALYEGHEGTQFQMHLGAVTLGDTHRCSLDNQIGFVRHKILERTFYRKPQKKPVEASTCIIL